MFELCKKCKRLYQVLKIHSKGLEKKQEFISFDVLVVFVYGHFCGVEGSQDCRPCIEKFPAIKDILDSFFYLCKGQGTILMVVHQ